MHYYTHNIGDFASQTAGMDCEQVGIFVRLVDRYVSTEKPITKGWVSLAFSRETKEKLLVILEELFEETDEGWVYLPAQKWVEEYQNKVESLRANGKKGGRPKKAKANENQMVSDCFLEETKSKANATLTNNHITNNHIKENKKKSDLVKPDGVEEELFDEWLGFKKSVTKAKTSQRMVDAMVREAAKAGISTSQAMVTQMENGWQGFKAEYVNKRNGNASFAFDPATIDYSKGLIENEDGSYSF